MKNTDKQTITNLINRIEQLTDDPEQALDWMYQGGAVSRIQTGN